MLRKIIVVACAAFGVLIFCYGVWYTYDHSGSGRSLGLSIILCAAIVVTLSFSFLIRPTNKKSFSKPIPVVRIWTNNGVTAVCAEADYQLWQQLHERGVRAKIEPKYIRPAPRYTAFFTDDSERGKALGDFWTGTSDDCDNLIGTCRVEVSELFIPRNNPLDEEDFTPVSPNEAWRLIYGFEPPEGMFAD